METNGYIDRRPIGGSDSVEFLAFAHPTPDEFLARMRAVVEAAEALHDFFPMDEALDALTADDRELLGLARPSRHGYRSTTR